MTGLMILTTEQAMTSERNPVIKDRIRAQKGVWKVQCLVKIAIEMILDLPSFDHKQKDINIQMFGQRIRDKFLFMPFLLVTKKK